MKTKFQDRPTSRRVSLYCEVCSKEMIHFMTDEEISLKTYIIQFCNVCKSAQKFMLGVKK